MTKYRADIDGLRAVAVLAVLLFHAGLSWFSGGFVGVDVFFVISGYVIAKRILEDVQNNRFSIIDFYVRRSRRIFPALFAMVLLTWITALFLFLPQQFTDLSKSTVATALFSSNIYFWQNSGYFDASALMRPLLHTWSLAVEEQYYIFMPVAVYAVARFGRGRWSAFFFPVAIISFALSVYATPFAPTANFFLLPTRAWELLLGALLVFTPLRPVRSRLTVEAIAGAALLMIGYAVLFFTEDTPFPGISALLPCGGAALLIYIGEGQHRAFVTRFISLKPMVWVGLISYSLYLVHWPTIVFSRYLLLREFRPAETLALVIASLSFAYLSYRFIEQPFRHPKPQSRSTLTLASAGATLALIILIGGIGVWTKGLPQRFPDYVPREIEAQNEWLEGTCFLTAKQTPDAWDAAKCTRTTGHGRNILLWGDSFAAHYVPGLMHRSDQIGANIIQYTAAGCRPILSYFSYAQPNCHAFNSRVPEIIKAKGIDEVIISARWVSLRSRGLTDLPDTLEQLHRLGVRTSVIGQSPEFPVDVQTLAYRQRRSNSARIGEWPIMIDPKINQQIRLMTAGLANYIDPMKGMCSGTVCEYMQGDEFLYMDFGHLSALGSDLAISRSFDLSDLGGRQRRATATSEALNR